MRSRVWLAVLVASLVANAVLAVLWWRAPRTVNVVRRQLPPRPPVVTNLLQPIRTNLTVEARFLSWRDIESPDYPTYIRNLRAIDCPPDTIRDIIVAEVNELFARRRATEIVTPNQQWWRSEPDLDLLDESMEKKDALEAERRELLTRLLGPNWDTSLAATEIPSSSVTLDGPLLGELPIETRRAIREIEVRNRERIRAFSQTARQEGRTVTPAELVQFRQEARAELAKWLTPAQLEEYLLRYSNHAADLRQHLRGFDATPDEFRTLFRVTDPIDTELATLGSTPDPATLRRRLELEAKREGAVKEALGADRYSYYKLNQDPVFQAARTTAEQLGAPAETVLPLYHINQETERERQRILNDPALTPEQQTEEIADVDQNRLDALRRLLGEERFRALQNPP